MAETLRKGLAMCCRIAPGTQMLLSEKRWKTASILGLGPSAAPLARPGGHLRLAQVHEPVADNRFNDISPTTKEGDRAHLT